MNYKLNELNEPIITNYNNQLIFNGCLSEDKQRYEWFRIIADGKVIILSVDEMKAIVDYFIGEL